MASPTTPPSSFSATPPLTGYTVITPPHPSPPHKGLTTTLYSPTTLSATPHLEAITHLVNASCAGSHTIESLQHLPQDIIRLDIPQQLVFEVGNDGFTFVIFASNADGESKTPIATASAKPWKEGPDAGDNDVGSETVQLFKRKSMPVTTVVYDNSSKSTDLPKWEILIMAVDLAHRKRGLATHLITLIVEEIKHRVCASSPTNPIQTPPPSEQELQSRKIILLLTTMKEKNEAYYKKKDFLATSERRFERGKVGSRDGFTVAEMEGVF